MTENPAGTKVEVLRILEICREIELQCAGIYHYYAEIFSDSRNMAELWEKTAQEEENHAYQFGLAINLRRQGLVQSVSIDQNMAETILNKLISLYEEVRRNRPGIADALRLAIEVEEKLSEYHLSTMALFQEESHRKLFEAMMKNDHDHVDALKKAYQEV